MGLAQWIVNISIGHCNGSGNFNGHVMGQCYFNGPCNGQWVGIFHCYGLGILNGPLNGPLLWVGNSQWPIEWPIAMGGKFSMAH